VIKLHGYTVDRLADLPDQVGAFTRLSVATTTVARMEPGDVVDPGDAALQALLASMAERTPDIDRRDKLLDFMMTTPPLADWPTDSLEALRETCQYVISLGRLGRELRQLTEIGKK
jgi:hypothetical protein